MSGFGDYPSRYPVIEDWPAYTDQLLPDIAAMHDGADVFRVLVDPMRVLDDQIASIYAGLVELEEASGMTLDLAGDYVSESRRGLTDLEYRRIIAGRRVQRAGAITIPGIWAMWVALTASTDPVLEQLGTSSIRLSGRVAWTPSDTWLSRAGRVVRDSIGGGYECTALVSPVGTAYWGDPYTGWGVGLWARQLRVLGAS